MATHYCISMPCWLYHPELTPAHLKNKFYNLPTLDITNRSIKFPESQGESLTNFGEYIMNTSVKNMLETVERIFTAAYSTVESLQVGERIQVKDLAQSVGLAVAMDPKQVLGFVNHFVHNTDLAYVTRGKNGGVIRGSKPVKVRSMKPLSGREASVLALLAQSQSLSDSEKRRILSSLEGQALKIAQVIVGETKHPAKAVRTAAEGFTAWAKDLPAGQPAR